MKKKILALCLFIILAFSCVVPAVAEPYRNYTFDDTRSVWAEPQAYVMDSYISSETIGLENLVIPADLNEGVFKLDGVKDPVAMEPMSPMGGAPAEGTEGEEGAEGEEQLPEEEAPAPVGTVLNAPEDFAVSYPDGYIAIADTGNNRIIILNSNREFHQAIYYMECYIPEEEQEGKTLLSAPKGVFFTRNEQMLYVADSGNARILKYAFNKETGLFEPAECLWKPEKIDDYLAGSNSEESEKQKYEPLKVVADEGGRIFVVSKGNHQGLIQLDRNGQFVKFVGATRTKVSFDAVWRKLLGAENRDQLQANLSTEYTNIYLDTEGLIFGTVGNIEAATLMSHFASKDVIGAQVKRITANGDDVLARNGVVPPSGDYSMDTTNRSTWSFFADVTVSKEGVYSCMDTNQGRIFTYNPNGELLYVFGAKGDTMGSFKDCVAIDLFDDSTIGVLDKGVGQITVFTPTQYGQTILKATMEQASRKYENALGTWNEVLSMSANSQLAYRNIGKIQYIQGKYEEACDSFMLAYDQDNYAKAFAKHRNQILEKVMPILMTVIIGLVAIYVIYKLVRGVQGFIKRGGREKHE